MACPRLLDQNHFTSHHLRPLYWREPIATSSAECQNTDFEARTAKHAPPRRGGVAAVPPSTGGGVLELGRKWGAPGARQRGKEGRPFFFLAGTDPREIPF